MTEISFLHIICCCGTILILTDDVQGVQEVAKVHEGAQVEDHESDHHVEGALQGAETKN